MSVVEAVCNRVAILDNGSVAEEGEVGVIFSNPKSNAAKRLVFPDGVSSLSAAKPEEQSVRVVFNGASAAGRPLISQMAIDIGVAVNILAASTRTISGKVYGSMLLGVAGGRESVEKAVEYLRSVEDVIAEEVTENVQ